MNIKNKGCLLLRNVDLVGTNFLSLMNNNTVVMLFDVTQILLIIKVSIVSLLTEKAVPEFCS